MMRIRWESETALLQQLGGVGPPMAPTFVLTVEDKDRFEKSRDIGCYAGLRPRRSDSGQSQPQLRISKEGDPCLRTMLVQGAHNIISRRGPSRHRSNTAPRRVRMEVGRIGVDEVSQMSS